MSLNCLEIENFSVSLEFFDNLKILVDELLVFIKEFRLAMIKYNTRLIEIKQAYKNKTEIIVKNIKSKPKTNFSKLLNFINSIPKIIETSTDNFANFNEEIEKELRLYENLNSDLIISSCKSQFEVIKNNLIQKENELKIIKDNFFNEMFNTEKNIYIYYYSIPKSDLNNINYDKIENEQNLELNIKENMENSIKNTKQKEDEYKRKAKEDKNEEDNFVKFSRFYSESIKKIANEKFEKLKHLILDFLLALKNYYKIPQCEIDSILPELINIDKSLKIEKLIEKLYHNDDEYNSLFEAEKYNLQILQKNEKNNGEINNKKSNNKSQNILEEIEKKVVEIEDGFGKMRYINDINTFLTVKKMKNNFELINLNNIDISIEEEKIKIYNLISKLLSSFKKEKDLTIKESSESNIISEEEFKFIESLIEKHHNRVIFFHLLNKFRSSGKYIMDEKMYDFFGKLFNLICDKIKSEKDMFSGKNIIILTQTYYYKNREKKEYLQKKIINHKIFKDINFWEELFNYEMEKEIIKINKSDSNKIKNNNSDDNSIMEEKKKRYSKLAFGQLMTLSNNMIDFGLPSEEVYKIIEPKIKFYDLSKDSIESIKYVINYNREEKNENNNKINIEENKDENKNKNIFENNNGEKDYKDNKIDKKD